MTDLEYFYVKVDFTNIITLYFLSNTMDLCICLNLNELLSNISFLRTKCSKVKVHMYGEKIHWIKHILRKLPLFQDLYLFSWKYGTKHTMEVGEIQLNKTNNFGNS